MAGCQKRSVGERSRQVSTREYGITVPTSPALISSQRAKEDRGLTVSVNPVRCSRPRLENGAPALRGDPKQTAPAGGTIRSC